MVSVYSNFCLFLTCNSGQVERVFSNSRPDPQEIEKAKKVLKVRKACIFTPSSYFATRLLCRNNMIFVIQEHEQALADAISRLADISDGESGKSFA